MTATASWTSNGGYDWAPDPSNSQYQMEYDPANGGYSFSDPYTGQSQYNVNNQGFAPSLGQAAQNFQTDFGTPGGAVGALPSGYTAPGAAGSTGTTGTPANTTATGLPTSGAVASDAPLPIQDFGATPSVTPTYAGYAPGVTPQNVSGNAASAATVDPNQSAGYMNQAYAQNAAALAPTFQQQASNLQDSSAARGISSSGAAGQLQTQLQGQQAATLASADEPITAQGYSYSQSDIAANQANQQAVGLANQSNQQTANLANQSAGLQGQEFNSGQQQTVNLANTATANQAAGTNAAYYADVLGQNASSYNNYLGTIENQGYNTGNEAYQTYLNSFAPNSGVEGAITGAESAGASGYQNAYNGAVAGQNATLGAAGSLAGNYFGNINPGSLGSGTAATGDFGSYGGGSGSMGGTGEDAGGF